MNPVERARLHGIIREITENYPGMGEVDVEFLEEKLVSALVPYAEALVYAHDIVRRSPLRDGYVFRSLQEHAALALKVHDLLGEKGKL